MVSALLVGTALLAAAPARDAPAPADLAAYEAAQSGAGRDPDAHIRLALWCEAHGLKAEASAHLAAVVRLDPARDAAWKRLGCKKVNGRWLTEAQIAADKAEAAAQKKADRHWKLLLARWRGWLGDKGRR